MRQEAQKDSYNEQMGLEMVPGGRRCGTPKLLPLELISRIPNVRRAYAVCIEEGIADNLVVSQDEVAAYLRIDAPQFNRALKGNGRHMPDELVERLEEVCGNAVVTQYLAYRKGYQLKPIRSALERENLELREQLAEQQREIETLIKYGVLGRKS